MTVLSRRHLMLTAAGAAVAMPFLGRGLVFAQEPAAAAIPAFLPTVHTRTLGNTTVTTPNNQDFLWIWVDSHGNVNGHFIVNKIICI